MKKYLKYIECIFKEKKKKDPKNKKDVLSKMELMKHSS